MFRELVTSLVKDLLRIKQKPHSNSQHIQAALEWLLLSQETAGQGYSSAYSLLRGWRSSYPETTGYIIPTMLENYKRGKNERYLNSALKAGDWLLSIQDKEGYFYEPHKKQPLVFDTGQVTFGLLALYQETKNQSYYKAAMNAVDWLLRVQHDDGYWQHFSYHRIPHAYHSRVSWALLEAFRITGNEQYKISAIKQLNWVLKQQRANGWFKNSSFFGDGKPVLHTIAYTIRGLLESGFILDDEKYINCARKTADALLQLSETEGVLYGYYDQQWVPAAHSRCLTGLAQVSAIWLKLYKMTDGERYLQQALDTNRFLKSIQDIETKNRNLRGAVAGSYPIWDKYARLSYPNWGAKFLIDALLLEVIFKVMSMLSLGWDNVVEEAERFTWA